MAAPMLLRHQDVQTTSSLQTQVATTASDGVTCTRSRTKKYTLNPRKSLVKKRVNCDRPFLNIIPKDGGRQLKIECSTGCYELLKTELMLMTKDSQISEEFSVVFSCELVSDLSDNTPEVIIKAANRLSSGLAGKKTKFTINLYNSQCSLLINGTGTPTFQDEILPTIMNKIAQKPEMSTLDRLYAHVIDRCLKKSIDNPELQASILADPVLPISDATHYDISMIDPESSKETLNICVHCKDVVDDGIACDCCHQWNHFDCEALDAAFVAFYKEGDTPYSCLSCRQLTLRNDGLATIDASNIDTRETSLSNSLICTVSDLRPDEGREIQITDAGSNTKCITAYEQTKESIHTSLSPIADNPDAHMRLKSREERPSSEIDVMNKVPVLYPEVGSQASCTSSDDTQKKSLCNPPDVTEKKSVQNPAGYCTPSTITVNTVDPDIRQKLQKKKKEKTQIKSDMQQQLEYSIATIHKLERKIDELEKSNKLLRSHSQGTSQPEKNTLLVEVIPPSDDLVNLRRKVYDLESEMLKSRMSNLENVQQLSMQLQTLSMMNSLQRPVVHSGGLQPPFLPTQTHGHFMLQGQPWTPRLPPPFPGNCQPQVAHIGHAHPMQTRFPPPQMVQHVAPRAGPVGHVSPLSGGCQPQDGSTKHVQHVQANIHCAQTGGGHVFDGGRTAPQSVPSSQNAINRESETNIKTHKNRNTYTRPPRFQHPNRRRPHSETRDMHSTPKKVRFANGADQDGQGLLQSPISIHHIVGETTEHTSQDELGQSFLGQGRATECTDRSSLQIKEPPENPSDKTVVVNVPKAQQEETA